MNEEYPTYEELESFREKCFRVDARYHDSRMDKNELLYPCYWCGTSGYTDGDCGATSCQCSDRICGKCNGHGELSKENFIEAYKWHKNFEQEKFEEKEKAEKAEYERLKEKYG